MILLVGRSQADGFKRQRERQMDRRDKKDLQMDGSRMLLCTYMSDTCGAAVHIGELMPPSNPRGAFGPVI